jgi:hypothetical protein
MEAGVLIISHIMALGAGFAIGKYFGYVDAQPERDRLGRFRRRFTRRR